MSRLKHLKKTNEVLSNEEDQEMFERVRATPPTLEFHRKQSLRSQLSKSLTNLDNKQSCPKWFQFTYSPLNQKSKSNTSILIPKSVSGSSCNISRSLQALCVCGNDSPLSSPISPPRPHLHRWYLHSGNGRRPQAAQHLKSFPYQNEVIFHACHAFWRELKTRLVFWRELCNDN